MKTALLVVAATGVLGVVLAWSRGALTERGRRWSADRHERRIANKATRAAAERVAQAEHTQDLAKLERHQEERLIERDRVGSRFRWRASKDDSGMIGSVVRLDPKDARRRVTVEWISPPGREPTPHDYSDAPTSIQWKHLTMTPTDQIHWTARNIARSLEDKDGWVQFERVARNDGKPSPETA